MLRLAGRDFWELPLGMHQSLIGAVLRNNDKKIRVIRSIRFIRSKLPSR
jgi:hypothetical protein